MLVTIVEWYPSDTLPVQLVKVVDGDTIIVRLPNGTRVKVRLVGYDAYEVSIEAARRKLGSNAPSSLILQEVERGKEAKRLIEKLLSGRRLYLKVDSLEPRDRYGRVLGYIWFNVNNAYCPLQKIILVVYSKIVVREVLYIPPDEYPYYVWSQRVQLNLQLLAKSGARVKIIIHNCTGTYITVDKLSVTLTRGLYRIYVNGKLAGICDFLTGNKCTWFIAKTQQE